MYSKNARVQCTEVSAAKAVRQAGSNRYAAAMACPAGMYGPMTAVLKNRRAKAGKMAAGLYGSTGSKKSCGGKDACKKMNVHEIRMAAVRDDRRHGQMVTKFDREQMRE